MHELHAHRYCLVFRLEFAKHAVQNLYLLCSMLKSVVTTINRDTSADDRMPAHVYCY